MHRFWMKLGTPQLDGTERSLHHFQRLEIRNPIFQPPSQPAVTSQMKCWVLFLLSKMPVVFRSSPMCKLAVITSGLQGGDTIPTRRDATLPNQVLPLNQRKHCNLSWRASLKIPRTFWSIKMFLFYFDSFFFFQSIRHQNKKPF